MIIGVLNGIPFFMKAFEDSLIYLFGLAEIKFTTNDDAN